MKREHAFTMIELMTVLALIAILAAMAAPSFNEIIKSNRLTSQVNDFIAAINLARSEAIKRNQNVILCRSADGTSCAASGGWEQGWMVFADANNNTNIDAGEELRIYPALAAGNTLRPNTPFTTRVTYLPRGYVPGVTGGTFVLCDDQTGDGDTNDNGDFLSGRAIIIGPTGRPRTSRATNSTFTDCIH
jgi:type IV fimbrial biogenesis protein FimT